MAEIKDKSATEILAQAMEDFGHCEPRTVMVIYTNVNDEVVMQSNAKRCEGLGMIEISRQMILKAVNEGFQ